MRSITAASERNTRTVAATSYRAVPTPRSPSPTFSAARSPSPQSPAPQSPAARSYESILAGTLARKAAEAAELRRARAQAIAQKKHWGEWRFPDEKETLLTNDTQAVFESGMKTGLMRTKKFMVRSIRRRIEESTPMVSLGPAVGSVKRLGNASWRMDGVRAVIKS